MLLFSQLAMVQVIDEHADQGRPIIFSSFQPDAVQLMRKLQENHPVILLNPLLILFSLRIHK